MDDSILPNGFYEIPHTADVSLAVNGKTIEDLFIHAAQGMYRLMNVQSANQPGNHTHFELEEVDLESLLVSYLTELLFIYENGWMAEEMDLKIVQFCLSADLKTAPVQSSQLQIKAVTFNNLTIKRQGKNYSTQIVFDI